MVYVLLEGDEPPTNRDESSGEPTDQSERVEDLREQVAYLREQLDREREARTEERRRHDTIIAQLSAANAALAARIPELEAPPMQEPSESPETVEQEPEGTSPRPAAPPQRLSLWRRVFGR